MEEDEHDEEDQEEENGELEVEEEYEEEEIVEEVRRGGLARGAHRQSGKTTGRSAGDRKMKPGNPGHAANPYTSNPGTIHPQPANHVPQQQRRLKERSSSSAPSEDAHISMMVFRIGIPDIKQTVSNIVTHSSVPACSPPSLESQPSTQPSQSLSNKATFFSFKLKYLFGAKETAPETLLAN